MGDSNTAAPGPVRREPGYTIARDPWMEESLQVQGARVDLVEAVGWLRDVQRAVDRGWPANVEAKRAQALVRKALRQIDAIVARTDEDASTQGSQEVAGTPEPARVPVPVRHVVHAEARTAPWPTDELPPSGTWFG